MALPAATIAATGAYAAFDIARIPKIHDDSDLHIIDQDLLLAERLFWSESQQALYYADAWSHRLWRQKLRFGEDGLPVPLEGGRREKLLELPEGGKVPLKVVRVEEDGAALLALKAPVAAMARIPLNHDPLEVPSASADYVGETFIDAIDDGAGGVYCSHWGTTISHFPPDALPTNRGMLSSSQDVLLGGTGAKVPEPQGQQHQVVVSGLWLPMSIALSPNGRTLVCASLFSYHLLAWDREPETGRLSNSRIWAEVPGAICHGICMDAEGCVWVSVVGIRAEPWDISWNCMAGGPFAQRYIQKAIGARGCGFVRIKEGGKVMDRIMLKNRTGLGCTLGGPDGRTLFLSCVYWTRDEDRQYATPGNTIVAAVRVKVPSASFAGAKGSPKSLAAANGQRSRL